MLTRTVRFALMLLLESLLLLGLSACELFNPPEATGVVASSGGQVVVDKPDSPLAGLEVRVPPDAFDSRSAVSVALSTTRAPQPQGARAAGISSFEIVSSEPIHTYVKLLLPFDTSGLAADEEVLLSWETEDGEWGIECAESIDRSTGVATFNLQHFTNYSVWFANQATLSVNGLATIDTGFDPCDDTLAAVNIVAPGNCAGFCTFAQWYWTQPGLRARPLRHRYGRPEAMLIAMETQATTSYIWSPQFLDSTEKDVYEIIQAMAASKGPVPVVLLDPCEDCPDGDAVHEVLAYKWDGLRLYCYDPNAALTQNCAQYADAVIEKKDNVWQCIGANGRTWPKLTKDRSTMNDYKDGALVPIIDKWAVTDVELSFSRAYTETSNGTAARGSTLHVEMKIANRGHPISYLIELKVAPKANHGAPIYSSFGTAERVDRGYPWAGSETRAWTFEVPADAPVGQYDVWAACYDIYAVDGYKEHINVVYDVTGNGPNSVDGPSAWVTAFEVPATPVGRPDLTVPNVTSPSTAVVGDRVQIGFAVKNQGDSTPGALSVGIYLSTSKWGTSTLVREFTWPGLLPLEPGASFDREEEVVIPSVPDGDYYVTVYVDSKQQVDEADEQNNIGSTQPERISIHSAPVPDSTSPSVPTGLAASASTGRIDLAWSPSTDNVGVAGYKVYQDGAFRLQIPGTTYSDTAVSAATRYCYRVSAVDAAGNESALTAEACASTPSGTVIAPTAAFSMTAQGKTAYENGTLNLTMATGGRLTVQFSAARSNDDKGISSHQWKVDGTPVSSNRDFSREFNLFKTYQIFLTVIDTDGLPASVGGQVTIEPPPVVKELDHIVVSGPGVVYENTVTPFTCTAYFTDTTILDVTGSASWSEDSPYATVSGGSLAAC